MGTVHESIYQIYISTVLDSIKRQVRYMMQVHLGEKKIYVQYVVLHSLLDGMVSGL